MLLKTGWNFGAMTDVERSELVLYFWAFFEKILSCVVCGEGGAAFCMCIICVLFKSVVQTPRRTFPGHMKIFGKFCCQETWGLTLNFGCF